MIEWQWLKVLQRLEVAVIKNIEVSAADGRQSASGTQFFNRGIGKH